MVDKNVLNKKNQALREYLRSLGSVAVAFSSGVDSTFLLKVAHEELRDDIACGYMRRFGAILRHQQAGFAYNAMVCFDTIDKSGDILAQNPHVSHCYERPAFEGFPYTMYAMMHAQSAEDLERFIKEAAESIGNPDYAVLHSLKELKKTSYRFFQ